ncbi:MAG: DUF4847 family protein [Bacteroidaceae bacterium]
MLPIKHYRQITLSLITIFAFGLLSSCDNKDDINAIFSNKKWVAVYTATTSDWNNDNKYEITKDFDAETKSTTNYRVITGMNSIQIKGVSATWTGTWTANASDHTFKITNLTKTGGNGDSDLEVRFLNYVATATYYRGDENLIKLFQSDKKSYILLRTE